MADIPLQGLNACPHCGGRTYTWGPILSGRSPLPEGAVDQRERANRTCSTCDYSWIARDNRAEERKQERILHLQQQLAKERADQARIERTPPADRTTEQIEMIGHHLRLQAVITSMLRSNNP